MTISIPSTFGQIDLERPTSQLGYYTSQYSLFIRQVIRDNLDYLFRGHALYGQKYERSSITDAIIKTFPISDSDLNITTLWRIEDEITAMIRNAVAADGRDGYGVYTVYRSATGNTHSYILLLTNDYRILEWEAGRGKVIEDDDVDSGDINEIISEEVCDAEENMRIADSIFSNKIIPKVFSTPASVAKNDDWSGTGSDARRRVGEIATRLEKDLYVDDDDLDFYNHMSITK